MESHIRKYQCPLLARIDGLPGPQYPSARLTEGTHLRSSRSRRGTRGDLMLVVTDMTRNTSHFCTHNPIYNLYSQRNN